MELKCICPVCGKVAGVESRDCIVAQHRSRAKDGGPSCGGAGQPASAAVDAWIARELRRPSTPGDSARRPELLMVASKRKGAA